MGKKTDIDGQSDGAKYKPRMREPTIGDLYPSLSKLVENSGASGEKGNASAFGDNAGHSPTLGGEETGVLDILSQLTDDPKDTNTNNSDVNNLNMANKCATAIQKYMMRPKDAKPKERKDKGAPRGMYRSKLIEKYVMDFSGIEVLGYIPANNTPGLVAGESAYLVKFGGETPFNLTPGKPFNLERVISYGKGNRSVVGDEKYKSGVIAEGIRDVLLKKPAEELAQNLYSEIMSGKAPSDFSDAFVLIVRSDNTRGK